MAIKRNGANQPNRKNVKFFGPGSLRRTLRVGVLKRITLTKVNPGDKKRFM